MNYPMVTRYVFTIPDLCMLVGWPMVGIGFAFFTRCRPLADLAMGLGVAVVTIGVISAVYGTIIYG